MIYLFWTVAHSVEKTSNNTIIVCTEKHIVEISNIYSHSFLTKNFVKTTFLLIK